MTESTLCAAVPPATVAAKLDVPAGTVGRCQLTSHGARASLSGDLLASSRYGLWTIGFARTQRKTHGRHAADEAAVSVAGRSCRTVHILTPVPVASLSCRNPAGHDAVTLSLQPAHHPLPPDVVARMRALAGAVFPALFTYRPR